MKRIIECVISPEQNGRSILDVAKNDFEMSTSMLGNIKFKPEGLLVDGCKQNVRYILKEGEHLVITLDDNSNVHDHLLPYQKNIDVVYENQDLIIINKEAGIVVHPSPGHYANSLSNMLVHYYNGRNETHTTRPIGRLDKDTSGLIIFAKNQYSAAFLEKCRTDYRYKREYIALCEGHPQKAGKIDAPLAPIPNVLNRMEVNENGQFALTEYQVLKYYEDYSLIRVSIQTGRTHQIRVHMSSIGHPLLGDSFYGNSHPIMKRAALHSHHIHCVLPESKEQMDFFSPLPEDFAQLTDFSASSLVAGSSS